MGDEMVYKLYSRRMKERSGEPEVYVYDDFPTAFRNQFFRIYERLVGDQDHEYGSLYKITQNLCEIFAQEKGLKCIPGHYPYGANTMWALENYIDQCDDEDFLDLMDFIGGAFLSNEKIWGKAQYSIKPQEFQDAIDELNERLKQHGLGYELINQEIVKKTNTVTHEKIVKPALMLLTDEEFRGAEDEYLQAFEHYKHGENKDAILNAIKAFESTMKTICAGMGYPFKPQSDTAKQLIAILQENQFYPSYLNTHMSGVRTTLESGAPTLRNKEAGHGQGAEVKDVSDEYVEYALNLVATNILFLYRIYKSRKGGN